MRRLAALVNWGAVLLGAAGSAVALDARGSHDVFRHEQARFPAAARATVLTAAGVEVVVAEAPEPVRARHTPPTQIRCRPRGGGVLRNPWSCTIRYRSGTQAYYLVLVEPDGHYTGEGTGVISGCCVKTPTLE